MTSLTCEKKNEEEEGDKKERRRGERAQAWKEEERLKSAIIMKDRNCIWARVLVTWMGWVLGKSSQQEVFFRNSLVYNYPKFKFCLKKNHKINVFLK